MIKLIKREKLTLLIILYTTILLYCFTNVNLNLRAQEQALIKIINPLTGDFNFYFDAEEYPVNSTFTVEFYIEDLGVNEDLTGWQVTLKWNVTIVNYTSVWIPPDNVFQGSQFSVIKPPPAFEREGDMGYLKYGASLLGASQPGQGVDIVGEALLFKANFTILKHPPEGEYLQTNLILVDLLPGSVQGALDTFILKPIGGGNVKKIPISAEPAQIIISKTMVEIVRDIAILDINVDKREVYPNDTISITVVYANNGSQIEEFNLTIYFDEQILAHVSKILSSGQNGTYIFRWNVSDVDFGAHTIYAKLSPLPDELDTENNISKEITIEVLKKLSAFEYFAWVLNIWLSTPFGKIALIYLVGTLGLLISLSAIRRLRSPRAAKR